jgi:hypothetical protein
MAAPATTAAARSGSASGSTSEALSPPISAWLGTPRSVAATATWRPTATEPVNERQSTSSSIALPVPAPPGSTWNSSAPTAGPSSSPRRRATAVASGEGLSRTALPKARAGAAFHSGMATGKFQGVISPATPRGRRRASSRAAGSGPG